MKGAMMKKKLTKRMELSKETVALLEQRDLVQAVGATGYPVCASFVLGTDTCCDWH